jgi:uracil-DNA glycosylase
LARWARQGVLLLNATLTVREGLPKSHFGKGWEVFTDKIVSLLYARKDPIVFLLWGKSALDKIPKTPTHHLILSAPHPSPLSAYSGFFGCKHFSKTNAFLQSVGKQEIAW